MGVVAGGAGEDDGDHVCCWGKSSRDRRVGGNYLGVCGRRRLGSLDFGLEIGRGLWKVIGRKLIKRGLFIASSDSRSGEEGGGRRGLWRGGKVGTWLGLRSMLSSFKARLASRTASSEGEAVLKDAKLPFCR